MRLKVFARRLVNAIEVIQTEITVALHRPRWLPLRWERVDDARIERVEAAAVQIGPLLHVINGYRSLDEVLSVVDVLDLRSGRWVDSFGLPGFIAQTHCGVVTDGTRYVYFTAGQVGTHCHPAVAACHVLDLHDRTIKPLPSLPGARYAPCTCLWNGRLHVVAGSLEDRVTPAHDHWSLAVENGEAVETAWREEPPIPLGGPHRAREVVDDALYVLGSQHYDRPPIPGDPGYNCDFTARPEVFFKHCFVFRRETGAWTRVSDMPVPVTHVEYSSFVLDGKIVVMGGVTWRLKFSDLIQVYDPRKDEWSIVGRMPWRNKALIHGYHDGLLYVTGGQRHAHRFNAHYGAVLKETHRTPFRLDARD